MAASLSILADKISEPALPTVDTFDYKRRYQDVEVEMGDGVALYGFGDREWGITDMADNVRFVEGDEGVCL